MMRRSADISPSISRTADIAQSEIDALASRYKKCVQKVIGDRMIVLLPRVQAISPHGTDAWLHRQLMNGVIRVLGQMHGEGWMHLALLMDETRWLEQSCGTARRRAGGEGECQASTAPAAPATPEPITHPNFPYSIC